VHCPPDPHEAFFTELNRWRTTVAAALWNTELVREDQLSNQVQSVLRRLIFERAVSAKSPSHHVEYSESGKTRHENGDFIVPPGVLYTTHEELKSHISYDFESLPPELLGRAYERLLTEKIVVRGGVPVVEPDPDTRRARGVYYTPLHVVDAMVGWTLGPLLEGKTPAEVGKLRLVDPACGSGAFLVGLYRSLLGWHLDWYVGREPQHRSRGGRPVLCRDPQGNWRLQGWVKREILLNNIFGLDLDPAALEVAEQSLLLVLLEGEGATHADEAPGLSLPHLSANLRCGNALAGSDSPASRPFDWEDREQGFGTVLARGGFDLVIGNPPYLSYSGRQATNLAPALRDYYEAHYDFAGWPSAHGLFIQRSVRKLSRRFVAFIVPAQVGYLDRYAPTRKSIDTESRLRQVHYWGEDVFDGVVTPSLSFVADKQHGGSVEVATSGGSSRPLARPKVGSAWRIVPGAAVLAKMRADAWYLDKEVGDPGVHTGNCAKLLIHKTEDALPSDLPVLEGKQIFRYRCAPPKKVLRADYVPIGKEYFRISKEARYSDADFVIRQTAAYPVVGPRRHATHFRNSLLALYAAPAPLDTHYVVGLLNSSLLRFAYRAQVQEAGQRAFPQVKVKSLRALPLKKIDGDQPEEQAAHDHIASHVAALLALHERLESEPAGQNAEVLRRQVVATDRAVDEAVFALYGLTASERDEVTALLADWES
jgi:hypothetical protein